MEGAGRGQVAGSRIGTSIIARRQTACSALRRPAFDLRRCRAGRESLDEPLLRGASEAEGPAPAGTTRVAS